MGSTQPATACTLTAAITNSWPGGYQVQLTVSNNAAVPGQGWTAGFSFGDTAEAVTSTWNAAVSQSGAEVTAANESYNAVLPAGGSTTWGMVVTGSNRALSALTCSLR